MLSHTFLSVMEPALPSSEAYIERRAWIAILSTGNFQWLIMECCIVAGRLSRQLSRAEELCGPWVTWLSLRTADAHEGDDKQEWVSQDPESQV